MHTFIVTDINVEQGKILKWITESSNMYLMFSFQNQQLLCTRFQTRTVYI